MQYWNAYACFVRLKWHYYLLGFLERANQSMINAEVAESANKDLQAEVQELRATVSRLNTEHARAVGWESKLRAVALERDDIRQERDAVATRARVNESRLVSLGDKNGVPHAVCAHPIRKLDVFRSRASSSDSPVNGWSRRTIPATTGTLRSDPP